MSFEKNLRRFSRALPPAAPPATLRDRVLRDIAPGKVAVARLRPSRKSAASRADRPANALPPFALPARAARVLRISARLLLGTIALTGIAGGGWWWHVNEVPEIDIPKPSVISPNSYPALIAATNKMYDDKAVNEALGLLKRQAEVTRANRSSAKRAQKDPEKPYSLSEKVALVAENADALRDLRAALKIRSQVPPLLGWNHTSPELAQFRQMARLLTLEGQVYEQKRQYGEAANAYLTAMELGERIGHGGSIIHKLVAISCEAIGRRYLVPLSSKLAPNEARSAIRRLEAVQARRSGMDEALAEEKRLTLTELNKLFRTQNLLQIVSVLAGDKTEEENGMTIRIPAQEKLSVMTNQLSDQEKFSRAVQVLRYSKTDVILANERFTDAAIADAKLPYDRARPRPVIPPDYLNQLLLPISLTHKEADARAQNALLIGKLAIEAYRKETKHFPANWQALVQAGYLRAAPIDPFAKNGTDTLRYVPAPAQKLPTGYLLYSIGPDGTDNGGTPIETNNRPRLHTPSNVAADTNKRSTEETDNGDFVLGINFY